MKISVEAEGEGRYRITCPEQMEWNARVDLVTALKEVPADRQVRGVIVDLQNVTYINSAGLGAIFSLRKYLQGIGAAMAVSRPSVIISRLLKTVNLAALVPVTDTLEQARAELGAARNTDSQ